MAGGQVAIPLQISGLEAKPKLINATTSLLKLYSYQELGGFEGSISTVLIRIG